MMQKKFSLIIVVCALLLCLVNVCLAERLIVGFVRDVNTHRQIRNVNVFIKDSKIGTTTDAAGRFSLKVEKIPSDHLVVFKHIGYEPREIRLDEVTKLKYIYLQPRVIPLQPVEIEEFGIQSEIAKDLPQTISVIESKNFEIQGYVDAADLLRIDHSVQVEERLSGKKTVSIRGGNPDEVTIMYNGIKMNSAYNNVFDLSLIDLQDIERFEIIKGSNTVLYGSEAFSGVINIVPKVEQDYNIRFQQRLGTYRSGNWGMHLYKRHNRLLGSYSYKRGGASRSFTDQIPGRDRLTNSSLHHTANLSYSFSENSANLRHNLLSAMYIYTSLDYENQRDAESLSNFNHLLSLKYSGDIAKLRDIDVSISGRELEEEQFLANGSGALNRKINEQSFHLDAEKRFKFDRVDLLVAYQFQYAKLDYLDDQNFSQQLVGLESAEMRRNHHGLVSIIKYHGATGSDFFNSIDLDLSIRHDRLQDEQLGAVSRSGLFANDSSGVFAPNDWQDTMVKFAASLSGYRNDLMFQSHFTFGSNTKFPTLFQQVSVPALLVQNLNQPNLNPEESRSLEISTVVTKEIPEHPALSGVRISGSYFQNLYENKFRVFSVPGFPVAFYDNAPTARIAGLEGKSSVFMFKKKVTVEFGISRYFIDEKAAFPFKSDFKATAGFKIDHAGYSFQAFWFKESEQVALLRQPGSTSFFEIPLPGYTNLDLHLSKKFELWKLKLFANASGRNLLKDEDTELVGLTIRDRRFYLTVGAQY